MRNVWFCGIRRLIDQPQVKMILSVMPVGLSTMVLMLFPGQPGDVDNIAAGFGDHECWSCG
jgi:hypothetical protein